MKILIIDDEKDIREIILKAMKRNGYEVTAVGTIADAAKQIQSQQWDLVISDVMIPYEGGFELVESIKETSDTPVILITGMSEDILSATINKADAVLFKPFTTVELLHHVKKLTSGRMSRTTESRDRG